MSYRSSYRNDVRNALAADARLGLIPQVLAWVGNVDAASLPLIGVVTPQERVAPDSHSSFERSTLLQVVLKRTGGDDLEDTLDDDAAAVEAAVLATFAASSSGVQCLPEEITTVVNADGEVLVGTLIATFRLTSWRPIGPQS